MYCFFALVASFSFVVADFNDCWSNTGVSENSCLAVTGCQWDTPTSDPWCDNDVGCCTDIGCWNYDGTNSSYCETNNPYSASLNCSWDPYMEMWYPNGTQASMGGCMTDWASMEGDNYTWGGTSEGCWQYDGDKSSCGAQGGTCKWTANDQNQDPWCSVDSLANAQNHNSDATVSDIGCCEQAGCWIHDNNESNCVAAFQGNCFYSNNTYGGGGGAADTTANDTINGTSDSVAAGVGDDADSKSVDDKEGIAPVLGDAVDFAKGLGWVSLVSILVALAVVVGVVWYFLKDKRHGFIQIKAKE